MAQATGGHTSTHVAAGAPPIAGGRGLLDPLLGRLPRWARTPEVLVTLLALAVFAWKAGRPSPWWDEAITRDVVARPVADILALAGSVDLVHATYYLVVHALLGTEPSFTGIRMISVVAAALTALLLVRIGRELDAPRVGAVAGVLWTVAPLASRYAQEARPYALVALAVTAATLALLRVCRKPWLPARWVIYSATLVAVGLLNVLALLVVAVHLAHVLVTASRAVRIRWFAAAGAAVLLLSPLLWATSQQRGQVSWLPSPGPGQLFGFLDAQYTVGPAVLGLVLLAVAGLTRGTHRVALGLGVTWALLPPVLLWTVSQAHPLYDWRYVFFALPGTALALASLATLLRPVVMAAVVVVLALAGAHMQEVYRWPTVGHAEDVRGTAEVIGDNARAGDAVVFLPSSRRIVALGYPDEFAKVDDVALAHDPVSSSTLWGIEAPPEEVAAALRARTRVWVVTGERRFGEGDVRVEREKERLLAAGFRLAGATTKKRYEVRLYVRKSGTGVPAADLAGQG